MFTFGDPTGLELPEVEVPGSGRLVPIVGETDGGVTEDITMVGGVMDVSKVRFLFSEVVFMSTVNVVDVVTVVVVVVVAVFESVVAVMSIFPSI